MTNRNDPRKLTRALHLVGLCWTMAAGAGERGAEIYASQCASCHGERGEGVPGEFDKALMGTRTVASLAGLIERTMPEEDPETCVGDDALAVAEYIHREFYSEEARMQGQSVRRDLQRLTVAQHRTSLTDAILRAVGHWGPAEGEPGLKGHYSGRNEHGISESKNQEKFDRVDSSINFDYGESSPAPDKFAPEEFSVRWEGSIFAPETGSYEIIVESQNGFRLNLNQNDGDAWDRRGPSSLIDAYVASGEDVRRESARIFLLGGRHYPIKLEYFKFKQKTGLIRLKWKAPHGVEEVIPARYLMSGWSPVQLVIDGDFPADDHSLGYDRGTLISRDWHAATTRTAVEAASWVQGNARSLLRSEPQKEDWEKKIREFAAKFVEAAFRRPLDDETRKRFIDDQLAAAPTSIEGLARCVLLVASSPRFLYPDPPRPGQADDFLIASRLALVLWDSVADDWLWKEALAGKVRTPEQIRNHARRMLEERRAKAKIKAFFHHWLEMEPEEIAKDGDLYPGFDKALFADLRTSLDLFLADKMWGDQPDYRDLLLADQWWVNSHIASLYGIEGVDGREFRAVAAGPGRSGLLTHPYLLSRFSYHNNTSPIHRGVFLTRNIIGESLGSPPQATTFVDDSFDPTMTMREKVTSMTRDQSCMSCHHLINPLGFSLENYDAVGRWREKDQDKAIDPTGEFPGEDGAKVSINGARDVAEHAVGRSSSHRAFASQMFHFLSKQPVRAYGASTLEELTENFVKNGFNMRLLAEEIAVLNASHTDTPESSGELSSNQ